MILDLPPHTEQAIIATAQAQGLTVAELLNRTFAEPDIMLNSDLAMEQNFDFLEKDGIYSDQSQHYVSHETMQNILDDLDQEPTPSPHLQALFAKHGGLNV